jgi:hypothetical protein
MWYCMASDYKLLILWFSELNGGINITCKRVGYYNILLLVDVKIWTNEHKITLNIIFVYKPNSDTCNPQLACAYDLSLFCLVDDPLIFHYTRNNMIQINTI